MYKTDKKARFQNSKFYFKYGISVPMVSSSNYIKKIPLVLPDTDLKEILDAKVKHVLALLKRGDKYEEKHILDIDEIIADIYGL